MELPGGIEIINKIRLEKLINQHAADMYGSFWCLPALDRHECHLEDNPKASEVDVCIRCIVDWLQGN
jgi:hypothetical protein